MDKYLERADKLISDAKKEAEKKLVEKKLAEKQSKRPRDKGEREKIKTQMKLEYIELKKTMKQFPAYEILSKKYGYAVETVAHIVSVTKINERVQWEQKQKN